MSRQVIQLIRVGGNNKARLIGDGPCYMDGLVSTGNKFPSQY